LLFKTAVSELLWKAVVIFGDLYVIVNLSVRGFAI